ncbi:phage integrase central domain-containing protein [Polaromonas sp.]|uniref:phage integrase central domain-containing protein n=1 Tax=Polaromonas sp. TaxID=1869339 RepID=UPI003BB4B854
MQNQRFEPAGLKWHALRLDSWSNHHAVRELRNLEKDLFPYFGARRIGEIEAIEVLAVIRQVEERGALDSAHRVAYGVRKTGARST